MKILKINANVSPVGRSMHSSIVYNDKIIIFGGEDSDLLWRNDCYIFETSTNVWQEMKGEKSNTLLPKRDGHCALFYENSLFVLGGSTSVNSKNVDCYKFDIQKQEWEKIEMKNAPTARRLASASLLNDKVFFFGGKCITQENIFYDELFTFSLKDFNWQKKVSNISPRCGHSSVSNDKNIYIFGGMNMIGEKTIYYNDVYKFDDGKFTKMECTGDIPSERERHSCILYKDYMIIYGGWVKFGKLNNDIYYLNLNTKKWTCVKINDSITPRFGHSMSLLKDKCYIFGGRDSDFNCLNDICEFEINIDEETKSIQEEPKVKIEETKEEPKEEIKEKKEEPKEERKEEPKAEPKEEPKEEIKEEPKEERKEEPKKEVKEEMKEEPKKEIKEEPKKETKAEKKKETKEIKSAESPTEDIIGQRLEVVGEKKKLDVITRHEVIQKGKRKKTKAPIRELLDQVGEGQGLEPPPKEKFEELEKMSKESESKEDENRTSNPPIGGRMGGGFGGVNLLGGLNPAQLRQGLKPRGMGMLPGMGSDEILKARQNLGKNKK